MTIDDIIKATAKYYGLDYLAEVAGSANVELDKITKDTLWQNILDDGQFHVDVYGHVSPAAHVQIMLLRPVTFDGEGGEWLAAKNALKVTAAKVAATILSTGEELGVFWMDSEPTYECGYDSMDANLAYCLVHLYLKEGTTCGEKLTAEWIESI